MITHVHLCVVFVQGVCGTFTYSFSWCFSLHAHAQGFSVEDQGAATAAKPPTTWDVKVLVAALLTVVSQRLFKSLG